MTQGRTAQWLISVLTGNGVARDITTDTLYFTAKRHYTDADADAILKRKTPATGITFLVAASGTATLKLVPSDTAALEDELVTLVWDLVLKDSSGNEFPLDDGTLVIKPMALKVTD